MIVKIKLSLEQNFETSADIIIAGVPALFSISSVGHIEMVKSALCLDRVHFLQLLRAAVRGHHKNGVEGG